MISKKAFAKVNLILNLKEKNALGRFETDFIMQEIELNDLVKVKELNNNKITIKCNDKRVPLDENNLCFKAAKIMQNLIKEERGIEIKLIKKIPSAGGLGGGSSDAATVIKILNQLWELNLDKEKLIQKINSVLGTDASFFIKGKTARISKNGLIVKEIENRMQLNYVFVLPKIIVKENKTAELYKQFKLEKITKKANFNEMINGLKKNDLSLVERNLFNAFEFSLPKNYSKIIQTKKELKEIGCLNAIMCGAGPTVFGLCENENKAKRIEKELKKKDYVVFSSKTKR